MTDAHYDDPVELAGRIAACPRPMVIGLDVDGVLAPIVAHADEARLSPGITGLLEALVALDGVEVAVVSGRSLDGLDQFELPPRLTVVGGHGGEVRGEPAPALDDDEQRRYDSLLRLAQRAAETAGHGAWVERKPLSVALHVRQADSAAGRSALRELEAGIADLDVKATPGSEVLELFARPASKDRAIGWLRDRHAPATLVYVGDDVTDEEAFRSLTPPDLGVKVGPGPTAAACRLRDPDAVRAWLAATVAALTADRTSH